MDFLSVKTLEGRKRKKEAKTGDFSHCDIWAGVWRWGWGWGWGWVLVVGGGGGEAWKMEAEGEIIAQRHKSRQKYSRAVEEKRISKAR